MGLSSIEEALVDRERAVTAGKALDTAPVRPGIYAIHIRGDSTRLNERSTRWLVEIGSRLRVPNFLAGQPQWL